MNRLKVSLPTYAVAATPVRLPHGRMVGHAGVFLTKVMESTVELC